MLRFATVALLATSLPLTGCASMNKQCFGNGVCRTERDGVVTWDGPPEEVAKMRAKEEAEKQAIAEADKAYAEAPKRPATEPIRLVLVGPNATSPDLETLAPRYRDMLQQSLQGDARIQLVPDQEVKRLLGGDSGPAHFGRRQQQPASVDEQLTRRLRDGNAEVDVVLIAQLAPKKVSGLVSGGKGGGVGVAEVNNVEISASLSSVYKFEEQTYSAVGKSTDSLNMAGVKDGKKSSVELKGKRNVEQDRPAVAEYAAWVTNTINARIAPSLPSLAAVSEIRTRLNAKRLELSKN